MVTRHNLWIASVVVMVGDGLSGPAIAGIAAGIPCSLLFLFLLLGLIYICVYYYKDKSNNPNFTTKFELNFATW